MGKLASVRKLVSERRSEDGLMALIHAHVSRFFERLPRPHAGVVIQGSHDPKDGTAESIIGPTAAIIGDDGDTAVNPTRIPMASLYGDQVGLRGDERVVMVPAPTRSGFIGITHYGEDDSPGAPAGEIWRVHRKADGTIDHFSKWTNDGPTAGDGLGGQVHSGFALHEVATAGGLSTTHNDTTKQIKKTANAQTYTIWDAQGNAISHVASEVGLGDLVANLDATKAAFRKTDADTLAADIKKMVGNALQQSAQAAIGAGVTNASAWLAAIQAGLPSLSFTDLSSSIASLTAPDGSSVVKIK